MGTRPDRQPRTITLGLVLSWAFGVLFTMGAFVNVFIQPVAGILLLLAGLVLLPPMQRYIQRKFGFELSTGLRVTLVIVLLALAGLSLERLGASQTPAVVAAAVAPQTAPSAAAPAAASVPTPAPTAAPAPAPAPAAKVRSATIVIARVTTAVANLQPIRVTVTNTGDVVVTPKFDVTVTDASGAELCASSPLYDDFSSLAPGASQTGEFSIMGCTFRKDGTYTVRVDLRDNDFTKLGSDAKDVTVAYWSAYS